MKKDRILTLINGVFPVSGIGFDSIAFMIHPAQSLKGIFLMIDLKIIGIFYMMGLHVMGQLLFTHNAIHKLPIINIVSRITLKHSSKSTRNSLSGLMDFFTTNAGRSFYGYLYCGNLHNGFARVRCKTAAMNVFCLLMQV